MVPTAQVVSDRVSDRSKGFGFVTFSSQDEAHKAVEEMNGKVVSCFVHMILWIFEKNITDDNWQALNGRVIFVDYAKPKVDYGGGVPIARGPPKPENDC